MDLVPLIGGAVRHPEAEAVAVEAQGPVQVVVARIG